MAQYDRDVSYERARRECEQERLKSPMPGFGIIGNIEQEKVLEGYRAAFLKRNLDSVDFIYDPRVDELIEDVRVLKKTVHQLKEKIFSLEEIAEENELVIREVPYNQAKQEIAQYFANHHGENIDPADVQEALGIDIMLSIKICNELESEGKIKKI